MISVVIPLYNQAATLARAVASVRAQTAPAAELIIVDDGSTDGGATAIAAGPDLRVIRQANRGVAAARNAGIAAARGELVALLDADDAWLPDHLAALAALAATFPAAVACATAYERVSPAGVRLLRLPAGTERFAIADYFAFCAAWGAPLSASSIAVRAAARLTALFPTGIAQGEDLVAWARLARAGTIAFDPRVSARYFVAERSPERPLPRPALPDRVAAELAKLGVPGSYLAPWHRTRALLFAERGEARAALGELALAIRADRPRPRDLAVAASLALPAASRRGLFAWRRARRFQAHAAAKASAARSNV